MRSTVAGLFVRPEERTSQSRPSRSPAPSAATTLAVVCAASDARPLGAAVALAAARARRSPCALVATWTGAPNPSLELVGPSSMAARRLAASLDARGLNGHPAGRLVHVPLPVAESEAAALAKRAIAAARAAPAVLVVGGPRTAGFDDVLAGSDLAVVVTPADSEPLIAELACRAMPLPAVVACTPSLGIAGRTLAAAGICLVPSLRAALRPVAEACR